VCVCVGGGWQFHQRPNQTLYAVGVVSLHLDMAAYYHVLDSGKGQAGPRISTNPQEHLKLTHSVDPPLRMENLAVGFLFIADHVPPLN